MGIQQIQVEKPITVKQLLKEEFGSKSNLFFVSVNGDMAKMRSRSESDATADRVLRVGVRNTCALYV